MTDEPLIKTFTFTIQSRCNRTAWPNRTYRRNKVQRMADVNEKVVQDAPVVKPKLEREATVSVSDTSVESYKTPLIPEIDSTEESSSAVSDADLIARAEVLYQEDKLLEAARLLRKVKDDRLVSPLHSDILQLAEKCDTSLADLIGLPGEGSGWTKQGESHGSRPTNIFNKLDEQNRLSSRIETPIEASLLVPLLSVFNETSMYQSWMPSSQIPPIGVRESNKLEQTGRANQLIQVVVDVPWPLYTREAIIRGLAVDDIDEQGCIFVRLSPEFEGPKVPPLKPFHERVDFDGGILFRSCPEDHELLKRMTRLSEEPLVLVSFKM